MVSARQHSVSHKLEQHTARAFQRLRGRDGGQLTRGTVPRRKPGVLGAAGDRAGVRDLRRIPEVLRSIGTPPVLPPPALPAAGGALGFTAVPVAARGRFCAVMAAARLLTAACARDAAAAV